MPGGRPRKPDEVKILEGTWRADRDGDPAVVPAEGTPVPPRWLRGEALRFWNDSVPDLVQSGVAKARDAAELASMCDWWARYRKYARAVERMKATDKRLFNLNVLAGMAWKNYNSVASRFGLTPSDRARLRLPLSKGKKSQGVMSRKRS